MKQELTTREIEVLNMISYEYSSHEIASKLYVSPHTVQSHRKNLLLKLDAKNTAGMIRKGFELGYLTVYARVPTIPARGRRPLPQV